MFGHIIAEHNATGGAALKQYIWLGDTPLALMNGTTLYYVHPDNLDRPVFMTNATAMTVAWQAKYDPFGVPFAVTVTPSNTQRLPGQWFQLEDGLSYNWHRTYDPTLGRYTQADPLGFVDGPGLYGYAGQSPSMWMDPWGLHKNDNFFGLPRPFWRWFHRHPDFQSLKGPDGNVCEADALSYYESWKSCGCPGPGNY